MNHVNDSFSFLIDAVIGFAMYIVMLRVLFQFARVNHRNPLAESVLKLTQPAVAIFRAFTPSIGRFDTAPVVLLFVLGLIRLYLGVFVGGSAMPAIAGALMLVLGTVLQSLFSLLTILVIIQVIASWVMPNQFHPAVQLLQETLAQFFRPIQRILPDMGGLDFSPVVLLVGLQFLERLLLGPIFDMARQLL